MLLFGYCPLSQRWSSGWVGLVAVLHVDRYIGIEILCILEISDSTIVSERLIYAMT